MDYNVYNYFLPDYTPKSASKYDTHKSSELRNVVQDIAKMTQTSPVYLVRLSQAKQEYALNIKDAAIALNNTLTMLAEDSQDNVFVQKKAVSSQNEQLSARIVVDDHTHLPEAPEIKVKSLATTQVNLGNEYYTTGKGLQAGTYRFRISVNEDSYDFHYNVRRDANHKNVLEGLSSFINKAKIGLTTSVVSRSSDKIMMRIESDMTGSPDGGNIFSMEDRSNDTSRGHGIVSYYNLNNVVSKPKSASFEMNGVPKSTLSNTFTIGKALEITLHQPGETAAKVSYIPDSEKILGGVRNILTSYNKLIDSTIEYSRKSHLWPRLIHEYRHLMEPYWSEMEACGFSFDDHSRMHMDDSLAVQAALAGDIEKLFGRDARLNQHIMAKNQEIKINPMEYVDKILVCYPDYESPPEGSSYVTSLYSGMLFSYYM